MYALRDDKSGQFVARSRSRAAAFRSSRTRRHLGVSVNRVNRARTDIVASSGSFEAGWNDWVDFDAKRYDSRGAPGPSSSAKEYMRGWRGAQEAARFGVSPIEKIGSPAYYTAKKKLNLAGATTSFRTMADVKAANKDQASASGRAYWFERGAMKFFNTKVESPLYGGRYFITSEVMDLSRGPRLYSIREAEADGTIETVGEFQGYRLKEDARDEIKRLLKA